MDELDPNAQGQQAQTDSAIPDAAGTNPGGNQDRLVGIERRIGELTAARRQAEEALAAKEAHIHELLATVSRLAERSAAPVEAPPEIDPDRRREVEHLVNPRVQQMEARMQQQQALLDRMSFERAVQSAGLDPAVEKRAAEVWRSWQQTGKVGWLPEDAVTFAAGEAARQERARNTQARQSQQQFNSLGQPLSGHSAAPALESPRDAPLPANWDSLSLDQQEQILEKRLEGKGF